MEGGNAENVWNNFRPTPAPTVRPRYSRLSLPRYMDILNVGLVGNINRRTPLRGRSKARSKSFQTILSLRSVGLRWRQIKKAAKQAAFIYLFVSKTSLLPANQKIHLKHVLDESHPARPSVGLAFRPSQAARTRLSQDILHPPVVAV